MKKSTYDVIDIILKCLNIGFIAFGLYFTKITINEYYKEKFWEEKLKIYSEVLKYTAIIATSHEDSLPFKEAQTEFYILYYGTSHLFNDNFVNEQLLGFHHLLEKQKLFKINGPQDSILKNRSNLKIQSLSLARACELSLKK